MTLKEYLWQAERLRPGTVIIEWHDLKASWEVTGGRKVQLSLRIHGEVNCYTYFVINKDTMLWTINDKGVMDKQSVFRLKEPL